MLEMLYRCRGTLGMLYRCREAQWMLEVSMDAEELHRCFGSSTDAWGPVDAAGFSGCAGTQRSLTPGGPWLLEALGCRGSVAAGGPPCLHRASHPSPAAGGGRISPRHPVPDAVPGGWCLVVSSSPSPRPARERGQSQHRRAMARGKVLSAWALLASLAVASWGVRGESAGVGSCREGAPGLVRFSTREGLECRWGKRNQCNKDGGACFAQCFWDSLMGCFIPMKVSSALLSITQR